MQRLDEITDLRKQQAEIFRKAMAELDKFKAETGLDTTTEEGRIAWKEWLGIPIPLVPSIEDPTREASCLRCRDSGWLTHILQKEGERIIRSDLVPCPNCSQWDEHRKKAILKHSGIPETKQMCTFESFKPVKGTEKMAEAAYLLSKGRAEYELLFIYGGCGNGKSHIAFAAALEAKERGLNVKFYHVGEFISSLKKAMNMTGQIPEEIIDDAKKCDFLILDELKPNMETPWQQTVLEEIINYRYNNELPLIVTSNSDQTKLSERILSRFKDAVLSRRVLNTAPDYRPKKRG